jgi:hypothetical protein
METIDTAGLRTSDPAAAHFTPQHDQLVSERRVLYFESALRFEGRDKQGQEEGEQRDHSAPTLDDSLT